jgi:hypothetical protein
MLENIRIKIKSIELSASVVVIVGRGGVGGGLGRLFGIRFE